jgi:Tol biopolymer transport system component/tRNA A-37 threonylcarbamoyl transferase component Bud32
MIGTTLSHFRVTAKLGEGGMGEVYRAEDRKLGREVAIKVLPPEFSRDPERLARFQQEARLLAGMSHRNIASIHGLENIDGVRFFVQELVNGHTLATIIRERSLEIDEVLDIGRQIADALEAAHAKDVVHRDLKPANIMVNNEGLVKVLDFGLARPVTGNEEAAPGGGDSTPTISTVRPEGVILGTAAYMSPDQARGRSIDARGDIWAFGCVLYEALARKKAFEGETLVDTISAVVRSEPDWDALPADTPPRLVAVIRRCLRKKLRERAQHAGDLRIELEEILDDPDHGTAAATAAGGRGPEGGFPFAALAGAALGAAAMGAMGAALLLQFGDAAAPPPLPVHASISVPEGARLLIDPISSITISPDGEKIVYAAANSEGHQLYLQDLRRFGATPIDGTTGATNPFFSHDGRWIGYFVENQALMKVPVDGGAPFEIATLGTGANGGTWLPDDTIVYAGTFTGTGLTQVPASGRGKKTELLPLDAEAGEDSFSAPQAIPGNRLLFTASGTGGPTTWILDLATGERYPVFEGANDATYVDTGHLVFSREGDLYAQALEPGGGASSDAPTLLLDGLFSDALSRRARFAVAGNGTLVYMPGEAGALRARLVWVDRTGNVTPLALEPGVFGRPTISPDGSAVAFDLATGNRSDIWTYGLEDQRRTRITDDGSARMPVWSPDGEQLIFASSVRGPSRIFGSFAGGGDETFELPIEGDFSLWPRSWRTVPTEDGRSGSTIAYYEQAPATGRDIWLVDYLGDDTLDTPRSFENTPANEKSPVISPDGRWLAYVSDTSGRDDVYVQSISGEGKVFTVSTGGGREPVWSRDGTELFYRLGNAMLAVPVTLGEQFEAGTPVQLFTGDFVSRSPGFNQYYDVDPSGQRVVMIQMETGTSTDDHLNIVVHFAQTALGTATTTPNR